jgi:hypothetical protein
MSIKINFKKTQRTLLPNGDYGLDIVAADIVDSKSSDGTNLKVKLVPNAALHPGLESAKITDIRSLAEESLFRMEELFLAAGLVTQEEIDAARESGEDMDFEEDDLVGKTVGATVYIDDSYDPKHPTNKVQVYYPMDSAEMAEEPVEEPAPAPVKKGTKK